MWIKDNIMTRYNWVWRYGSMHH